MIRPTVSPAGPPPLDERRHARRTLALSGLAVLATFLDTTVLFVAFPDIVRSFPGTSAASLSWVLNAYTITFAALLVPAGKVADRVGHKRAFLSGSVLFTVSSLACAIAPGAAVLIAFRIVQAVGAAALIPSSLALVLRAFPPSRIPVAVAIWGAQGAMAGALGPTLGSALVQWGGWRWVFLVNLPVGLVTVGLGWRVLRESADPTSRIPAPGGVLLLMAAAAAGALGIVQSDSWGVTDARTLTAVAAAGALALLFVAHQRRTSSPTIDPELFRARNYRWANAATFTFGTAFTAMFFGSFLFLTEVWDYSVLRAGLGISPGPLLVGVLAPLFGRLTVRVGQRPLLVAGGLAYAAGGAWRLAFLDGSTRYVTDYLPSMLLTGVGVALCFPQLSSAVAQAIPRTRLGVGGAVNQAIRQFGGTIGVAAAITIIGAPRDQADALVRFERIWLLIIAGGVVTSLLCLRLTGRARNPLDRVLDPATPAGAPAPAPAIPAAAHG